MYLYCDESAASPLIISISPSLNRRPSPGSRREWVCERGGALKQPGLAACDEAHLKWMEPHHRRCYMPSAPLLWRPVSSPCMHAGVLVGSRKGASSVEDRTRETADGPGCRAVPLEAPRAQRRTKPLMEAAALAPRTQEGSACGHRTPPLTWTLPSRTLPLLHNPRSTTRTSDPLFILDTSSPLDTILLFLLNKSLSEAWRHTHCVCRLLLPPQYTVCMYYCVIGSLQFNYYFIQPQIRKSWDSMENANKKRK